MELNFCRNNAVSAIRCRIINNKASCSAFGSSALCQSTFIVIVSSKLVGYISLISIRHRWQGARLTKRSIYTVMKEAKYHPACVGGVFVRS